MALFSRTGFPRWIAHQPAEVDHHKWIGDIIALSEKKKQKYKPDLSLYQDELAGLDAMAGDKQVLHQNLNNIFQGIRVSAMEYGGDWSAFIKSPEWRTYQSELDNWIYDAANAEQSKAEYLAGYQKLDQAGALDQIALINGEPTPGYSTKGELLSSQWGNSNIDPTSGRIAKAQFDTQTGDMGNAYAELDKILGSVGSSTGTPAWQNISHFGPEVVEAFKVVSSSPWGSSNHQQLTSALKTVVGSSLSEEAQHGLMQDYWKARRDSEAQGIGYSLEPEEHIYNIVHDYAKSKIEENLGMPKSGKTGDGSGDGDPPIAGYFWAEKNGVFTTNRSVDPVMNEQGELVEEDVIDVQISPDPDFRKKLYPPGTRLSDWTKSVNAFMKDQPAEHFKDAIIMDYPTKAKIRSYVLVDAKGSIVRPTVDKNGNLAYTPGGTKRRVNPSSTTLIQDPFDAEEMITEAEYAERMGWVDIEDEVWVAVPEYALPDIKGWILEDQYSGGKAGKLTTAATDWYLGIWEDDDLLKNQEWYGGKTNWNDIQEMIGDHAIKVPENTRFLREDSTLHLVKVNIFRPESMVMSDPVGTSKTYAATKTLQEKKMWMEFMKNGVLPEDYDKYIIDAGK